MSLKILVVPDLQVKPGLKLDHVTHISKYIRDKKPDVVVQIGDLWDFPSLSSYDKGKKSAEGRRVDADFEAGCRAVELLMEHAGNHEERLLRAAEMSPELDGTLPDPIAYLTGLGWEAHPFLKVVRIAGVAFAHFFPKNSQGRVTAGSSRMGAPSALAQIKANMESCVAGHRQGLDVAIYHAGRTTLRGIIAGSAYRHEEHYLGPQGENYWRGVLMLHEVRNGTFSTMEVTLDYLREKYS
jgi:hypothetical protein